MKSAGGNMDGNKNHDAYRVQRDNRARALRGAIPFISKECGLTLPAGFSLIGGNSGRGKTTTAANLVAGALRALPRAAYISVVLNEEVAVDFWERVACILAGESFFAFRGGTAANREAVEAALGDVLERVDIYDGSTTMHNTNTVEDVLSILKELRDREEPPGFVLYDYIQNTRVMKDDRLASDWTAVKTVAGALKQYSREILYPLVVMAQLTPTPPAGRAGTAATPVGGLADIRNRIQLDRQVMYNNALSVFEVVPDIASGTTSIIVHKDRFGEATGQTKTLRWQHGILAP